MRATRSFSNVLFDARILRRAQGTCNSS